MIENVKLDENQLINWLKNQEDILFVCGNDCDGENESRDGFISSHIRNHFSKYDSINILRAKENIAYHFDISINKEKTSNILWYDIKAQTSKYFKDKKTVILDITGMDLDILLYILPVLKGLGLKIYCLYVTPKSYIKDDFTIETCKIQQPKGYTTFLKDDYNSIAHLILLGFDNFRVEKFIQEYDWDMNNINIAIVSNDDSYVKRAIEASGPTIQNVIRNSDKKVDVKNPNEISIYIDKLLLKNDYLDIVPLGPKSILLGILLNYLSKDEKIKNRIRLLYDFPITQKGRSEGIGEIFCFDCSEALR